MSSLLLISLARTGAAPKTPVRAASRSVDGPKVLGLTSVIAGPICGLVLTAHGANVLAISAPHLPSMAVFIVDVGRGKRSLYLNRCTAAQCQPLAALIGDADIFRARLPSRRPNGARIRSGGGGDAQAWHHLFLVVGLRPYWSVGRVTRFRFHSTKSDRSQP